MDHIHLPDPVKEDIANLRKENSELTNRLLDLERTVRRIQKGAARENENL